VGTGSPPSRYEETFHFSAVLTTDTKAYIVLYWPSAMVVPIYLKVMAHSIGCFALIKKYYENAKALLEVTQRNPTERKGVVDFPCFVSDILPSLPGNSTI
jgi:hypothetical protein